MTLSGCARAGSEWGRSLSKNHRGWISYRPATVKFIACGVRTFDRLLDMNDGLAV